MAKRQIKPMHQILNRIEKIARQRRAKIAIGVLRPNPEIISELKKGSKYADLTIVCKKPIRGLKCIALGEKEEADYSDAVIELLETKKVEGIVRGHVKFGQFLARFMQKYGYTKHLEGIALQRDILDREWFWTSGDPFDFSEVPEHKIRQIEECAYYMRRILGMEPMIGVLAGDFTFDRGDDRWIDQTIHNAEYVVKVLADEGYKIKNYAHLIDEAVANSNLLVTINGSQGNFLYRALYQFGGGAELGESLFVPEVYIECSRYHNKYLPHIIWATAEANLQAKGKLDKIYDPYKDPKKKWSNFRVIK